MSAANKGQVLPSALMALRSLRAHFAAALRLIPRSRPRPAALPPAQSAVAHGTFHSRCTAAGCEVLLPARRRSGTAPRCRSWCRRKTVDPWFQHSNSSEAGHGPSGSLSSGSGRNSRYLWGSRRCPRCRSRNILAGQGRELAHDVVKTSSNEAGRPQARLTSFLYELSAEDPQLTNAVVV